MMKCIYQKFDAVYEGLLFYTANGMALRNIQVFRRTGRKYKNKAAFISFSKCSEYDNINFYVKSSEKMQNQSLYVCPECSIPRDLLRHSGYKIVLSKDTADTIVIPDFRDDRATLYFDVAAVQNNKLYLLTITRMDYKYSAEIPPQITYDVVNEYLKARQFTVLGNCIGKRMVCDFVPYVEIYNDMVADRHFATNCVTESHVERKPTTVICPDTLIVWYNMRDKAMFEQSVLGSDWNDYPTTLCLLLYMKDNLYRANSEKFRHVMRQICFVESITSVCCFRNRVIQPKDWNMMQDFIASFLGVDKSGSYLPLSNACSLDKISQFMPLLHSAIALKPKYIEAPMLFDNIFCNK